MKYVFDLDGTLVDSKEKTIAAYETAAPGLFKPEYWGKTAAEWGCPPSIHRTKQMLFNRDTRMLQPGWALPMFMEVLRRGEKPIILTGASSTTVKFLLRYISSIIGDFHTTQEIHSADAVTKINFLDELAKTDTVYYYDDQAPAGLPTTVIHLTDSVLPETSVVVVAAGYGARFRTAGVDIPKPLLRYRDRQLIDYALCAAKEVALIPGLVTTPEVDAGRSLVFLDVDVVKTRRLQPGPVASALLASIFADENDPIIFLDSDVVLSPGSVYRLATQCAKNSTLKASVLVASRDLRVGSYGGVDRQNLVVEASLDCPLCNVGAYWFRSFSVFRRLAAQALLANPNQELKFSHLLSWEERDVWPLPYVITDSKGWIPLGTPDELTTATRRAND